MRLATPLFADSVRVNAYVGGFVGSDTFDGDFARRDDANPTPRASRPARAEAFFGDPDFAAERLLRSIFGTGVAADGEKGAAEPAMGRKLVSTDSCRAKSLDAFGGGKLAGLCPLELSRETPTSVATMGNVID